MDSNIRPNELIKAAKKRGMDAIAVTDHDTAKAWKNVERAAKEFPVIANLLTIYYMTKYSLSEYKNK